MCAGWSEERLASLFDAVADLRRSLKSIGSTLVIRKGRSKAVLLAIAQQVNYKLFFFCQCAVKALMLQSANSI